MQKRKNVILFCVIVTRKRLIRGGASSPHIGGASYCDILRHLLSAHHAPRAHKQISVRTYIVDNNRVACT